MADAYRAEQALRPCREEFTYASSMGGHTECATHGGIFGHCKPPAKGDFVSEGTNE